MTDLSNPEAAKQEFSNYVTATQIQDSGASVFADLYAGLKTYQFNLWYTQGATNQARKATQEVNYLRQLFKSRSM